MKKRGIFPNKKAQGDIESYFILIKLILAIAAIAAMSAYVYSVASDTFFSKLYLSRDLAFTINTLYIPQGNIYHEYERKSLNKFTIDFLEQKVEIREEDPKKKGLTFDYFYAADLNYTFKKEEIKEKNKITLQKSSNLFEINTQLSKKLKILKCPDITTLDPEWKKKSFLIDPALGKEGTNEGVILGSIGISLYDKFDNWGTTRDNIGAKDIKEQTRKSLSKIENLIEQSDIIIGLRMGDYPTDNNIKIYVSSIGDEKLIKKREKLSCLIINRLFSDKDLDNIFTGGNVIKQNPEHIKEDYAKILNNGKISIIIEIGNLQNEKIKDLESTGIISKIADSIYEGIKEYYE